MFQSQQSHSLETLQILSQSKRRLTSSATDKIRYYLLSQVAKEGGFCNRKGEIDLYYTFFGLICALLMDVDLSLSKLEKYLDRFDVETLSMVHLTCLVKCRVLLKFFKGQTLSQQEVEGYCSAMNKFRTSNGSFSYDGQGSGFPYAAFLALNFYQDLGLQFPEASQLLSAIDRYRTADGAFRNPAGTNQGMLLSTIAAVQVIRHLTEKTEMDSLNWIKSQYQSIGGFRAHPRKPASGYAFDSGCPFYPGCLWAIHAIIP